MRSSAAIRFDTAEQRSSHSTPSVLNSHEADARANYERLFCLRLHILMLLFSLLLIGLTFTTNSVSVPLGLLALGTSVLALLRLSSLRGMSVGCCCSPIGASRCIFGMNVALLVGAVLTLGLCIWQAVNDDSYSYTYRRRFHLSITAAITTFATIVCSILAMIKLSALQRICMENVRPQSIYPVFCAAPSSAYKFVSPDDGSESIQSTPFGAAAVPHSVLVSHEADARANSVRILCFRFHILMLVFSLVLVGVSLVEILLVEFLLAILFSLPSGLVAVGTSVFAVFHLSSLRDMSVGCCCTPLGAYSWIFGMNVWLLVFAVPSLMYSIWTAAEFSSSSYEKTISRPDLFGLSLTAAVTTFGIIVCSGLAMKKLSTLQRLCTENLRRQGNFSVVPSAFVPGYKPENPDRDELEVRLIRDLVPPQPGGRPSHHRGESF
jgi:hypothetical protein